MNTSKLAYIAALATTFTLSSGAWACGGQRGQTRKTYVVDAVDKESIRLLQADQLDSRCGRVTTFKPTPEQLAQFKDKLGLIVDLSANVVKGFVNEASNPTVHSFLHQTKTRDGKLQIFEGKIVSTKLIKQEAGQYNPDLLEKTWEITIQQDDGSTQTFTHVERIRDREVRSDYVASLDPNFSLNPEHRVKYKIGDVVRVRTEKTFDSDQFTHYNDKGSYLLSRVFLS